MAQEGDHQKLEHRVTELILLRTGTNTQEGDYPKII